MLNDIIGGYRGSTLKKIGVPIEWTPELLSEYLLCKDDPIYFANRYMYAITLDEGKQQIKLRDYQEEFVLTCKNNRYSIGEMSRQSGKTTSVCAFVLWSIIFQADYTVAILANKAEVSQEILSRIQLAYEHLPKFLQQGILEWNKRSFTLENQSRVIAAATSSKNIRGFTVNCLIIDECAHIENWDEFYTSVFPVITSGKNSKIVLISSVYGLNHFYKFTELARQGKNQFKLVSVPWQRVPGRDENWRQEALSGMNFDEDRFAQEFENQYLGSSGTLIAGWKLKELVARIPIYDREGLMQYIAPEKGHKYALVADVAEGVGLDAQAFSVIDITQMPYNQVCTYKNNKTSPIEYAEIIYNVSKMYCDSHGNHAATLVENNNMGDKVCHILHYDLEHPNIIQTQTTQIRKTISFGYGGKTTDKGIRTTKSIKKVGCSVLKLLIEQNQLIINDYSTIFEFSTFSRKGEGEAATYAAEEGKNDDMVMGLVLFAWLSHQEWFKEDTDINTLGLLRQKSEAEMMDELSTFITADSYHDQDLMIDGLPSELVDEPVRFVVDPDEFVGF